SSAGWRGGRPPDENRRKTPGGLSKPCPALRRTGEPGGRQAPQVPPPDPGGIDMGLTWPAGHRQARQLSRPGPSRQCALVLTSVAFFMVALDALVVITALPAIHRDLGGSVSTLEWTVNAYTLSFAAGIITAAALGDRLGRRRVYVVGLLIFTV